MMIFKLGLRTCKAMRRNYEKDWSNVRPEPC